MKEKNNEYLVSETLLVDNPSALKMIDHPIRLQILNVLAENPMYPAELAKELKMHEQKVYYHIKQMVNSGVLEIVEKKEIRGTTAKRFAPRSLNFSVSLSKSWRPLDDVLKKKESRMNEFLSPFFKAGKFNSSIVVGSPDPHGAFKARARDGHYAIDLALFLGHFGGLGQDFATKLDVDADMNEPSNFVLVGGPVTNLMFTKINDFLPAKFSDKKPWGIITGKEHYTEDSIGLLARIPNPYNPDFMILVIAGIRFIGTKAAVMALTRYPDLVLSRFSGQKKFSCIVQGFDLDGDGKIDSIEVLE
ncbi:MAG: ArsR family transcriptional regulator [Nanoarchaeota archaeon]|nr:ArsR family transcriptional regulator [Nanoarchaeota archaeon]